MMPKKRLGAATFKTDRNFDLITQQTAGKCFSYDLDYKGENIARMHACKERQVSDDRSEAWDTLQIVGLRVNPEWQRKGVSTWLTQQVAWRAEDDGRNLQSDFLITHMREPFWKKQLEKGRIEAVVTDHEGRKSYILKKPVPESLDGLPRTGRSRLMPKKLGAFTSNAELDKFRYVFRKKSGGHSLSVYDGTSLIGKLILQTDVCFPAGTRHAEIVAAEIVPEYRGKKLYQEMLLRTRDYAKAELGCKGLLSRGFERSSMASRAWAKLNPRVEERPSGRPNLFLDGLPRTGRIPLATVKRALRSLPPGRKACGITLTSLRKGMEIEREHFDVTKLGVKKTAIIAAAHLCESPRYYDALQKMERRLKRKK